MGDVITPSNCRVCFNVEELMVNIYEEVEDLSSDLSTLLEQCGDLKVEKEDCLPKYLCKECTSELLIAAKFREKCIRTKEFLKRYESGICMIEEETIDDSELVEIAPESPQWEVKYVNVLPDLGDDDDIIIELKADNTNDLIDADAEDNVEECEEFSSVEDFNNESNTIGPPSDGLISVVCEEASYSPVGEETTYTPVDETTTYTPADDESTYTPVDETTKYTPIDETTTYTPIGDESTYTPVGETTTYTPVHDESTYTPVDEVSTYRTFNGTTTYPTVEVTSAPMASCPTTGFVEQIITSDDSEWNNGYAVVQSTAQLSNGSYFFNEDDDKKLSIDSAILAAPKGKKVQNAMKKKTDKELMPMEHKFVCDSCGAAFAYAQNLQRHMNNVHVSVCTELFICDKCKHCFSIEENYMSHCADCGSYIIAIEETSRDRSDCEDIEKTESGESIEFYVQVDVSSNGKEMGLCQVCKFCQKEFKSKFALNMHLRTHTGERPFACHMCTKTFKTRSALSGHMKRHMGRQDYICSVCQRKFYDSSNLQTHMRSHTGVKPHICTICGKCFSRVFLLQIHMRTHTGERPYPCPLCERSFAQLCDLKNHVRTHTKEREFKCSACPKSYVKRRSLLEHMRKHSSLAMIGAEDTSSISMADSDFDVLPENLLDLVDPLGLGECGLEGLDVDDCGPDFDFSLCDLILGEDL